MIDSASGFLVLLLPSWFGPMHLLVATTCPGYHCNKLVSSKAESLLLQLLALNMTASTKRPRKGDLLESGQNSSRQSRAPNSLQRHPSPENASCDMIFTKSGTALDLNPIITQQEVEGMSQLLLIQFLHWRKGRLTLNGKRVLVVNCFPHKEQWTSNEFWHQLFSSWYSSVPRHIVELWVLSLWPVLRT